MTREEAISIIERVIHTEAKWPGTEDTLEALDMALSALCPISREQVERMRGGWRPTEYPFMGECEDCSVCGYRTAWGHGFRFCPHCGAPMTDEAMEMVMERLEKMKNG